MFFYLYETVMRVRNDIDLKHEFVRLENYGQVLDELDTFETERKSELDGVSDFYLSELESFKK